MKALLVSLTMFVFSTVSFSAVAGSSIEDAALNLAKFSGMQSYALTGETPQQLIESLQQQIVGEGEIVLNAKSVEPIDEMIWGTTDARNFSEVLFSAIHFMDDDAYPENVIYSETTRELIRKTLRELQTTDVIYSWNPIGTSSCGQMLTTPVLIDPKAKKAYEFNFYTVLGC
jgi:hypothetical protein